jgi:AraC-like DNA-binding protein
LRNKSLLLPFGNDRAITYVCESEFADALRALRLPVADLAFSGADRSAGISAVRVGELAAVAVFSEPLQVRCLVDPHVVFALPLAGSGKVIQGSQSQAWAAHKSILVNSHDRPVEFVATANSVLTLQPSGSKLLAALNGALRDRNGAEAAGAEGIFARLLARGPMVDTGRSWPIDYFSAILNLAAVIDDCACDETLLARIGLEDVLNRLLAELILHQEQGAVSGIATPGTSRSVKAVDLICDHIRSSIGSPLSISRMEELTGLTGRALSYAFRSRFDCSPQEWQRNFLLDHARPMLKDRDYTGSVKALAYELGFSSPSSFAAFYKARFGELPSETLARSPRSMGDPRPQK